MGDQLSSQAGEWLAAESPFQIGRETALREVTVRYHHPESISQTSAQKIFTSGTGLEISTALVSVAFHEPDWRWVQGICLQFARHPDASIRSTAAICFGHLARIHRSLDLNIVLPVLRELATESETSGQANDALDDIETYLGKNIER